MFGAPDVSNQHNASSERMNTSLSTSYSICLSQLWEIVGVFRARLWVCFTVFQPSERRLKSSQEQLKLQGSADEPHLAWIAMVSPNVVMKGIPVNMRRQNSALPEVKHIKPEQHVAIPYSRTANHRTGPFNIANERPSLLCQCLPFERCSS